MERMHHGVRISRDRQGTPSVFAESVDLGYWGLGWLHGHHRPLQSLILLYAARGELSRRLVARPDLVDIDSLVHRLEIPALGERAAARLEGVEVDWLDAYREGLIRGLEGVASGVDCRLLGLKVPELSRGTFISALMVSGFLGLAQSQERMERAIVEAVKEGADTTLLEEMFTPHLQGWEPALLGQISSYPGWGMSSRSFRGGGGSNAWAVQGSRSHSGSPVLCGDPHLQVNQLPALFFEVRVRVGEDYWLGASIPGIPGIAVGRNRRLAWSGTFGVADNSDFFMERVGEEEESSKVSSVVVRERSVELKRRFQSALPLSFHETERGVLETLPDSTQGPRWALANRWSSSHRPEEGLRAFMRLPQCQDVDQAQAMLAGAHTLSLHFVLADKGGDIRYCQLGSIPKRDGGWSGLYPAGFKSEQRWCGLYTGDALPRMGPEDGCIVSANEARLAHDGGVLSTLAQPGYRVERITELLCASEKHSRETMASIQLDVLSLQAKRLWGIWEPLLEEGPLKREIRGWDYRYTAESRSAHAFHLVYWAALGVVGEELGGDWMHHMLRTTEISVWWCNGLDRLLLNPEFWTSRRVACFRRRVQHLGAVDLYPWGKVQSFSLDHLVFGGLPEGLGFNRGTMELPGSIATVRQGNLVPAGSGSVAVGPAYRMICDLADDGLWTSIPGGISGSRFTDSYDKWVQEWSAGEYHRLEPPQLNE